MVIAKEVCARCDIVLFFYRLQVLNVCKRRYAMDNIDEKTLCALQEEGYNESLYL